MNALASSSRAATRSLATSAAAIPRTTAVPGYNHYNTPLRKLIIDYHPDAPSQHGVRAFIRKPLVELAKQHPDVEILVRKIKQGKAAVLRGHYVNGRDKVICVRGLEADEVINKATLLLNSTGSKLRHLRNSTLEPGPGAESARGVWSGLHESDNAEYRI